MKGINTTFDDLEIANNLAKFLVVKAGSCNRNLPEDPLVIHPQEENFAHPIDHPFTSEELTLALSSGRISSDKCNFSQANFSDKHITQAA
ncbi:hypothetical protein HHI36_010508 [Cryptolaemus montrouzieri]|uniref:Uncharacterized protein n=1 Tax=Cryptolaemus montrouzieri TaxID=559131 RepID=A0ABD2MIW9_9CUCU